MAGSKLRVFDRRWIGASAKAIGLALGVFGFGALLPGAATAIPLAMTTYTAINMPLPGSVLAQGALVSPSAAYSFYTSATTHTNGVAYSSATPPEIASVGRALGAGRLTNAAYVQNVFDYVRNNIATEFHFGLAKGARGALVDQSGTSFDQAELMVKLLRYGNVGASYQLGSVDLTAQQFGQWTGLIKGLNQTNQTFTVDAKSACQFLADGGVPALVENASSCSGLSGDLPSGTPVTMVEIWVSANGSLYDPAFKPRTFKAAVDLSPAIGCVTSQYSSCGAALTSQVQSGATISTLNGNASLPTYQHLNETAVQTQLSTYAQALQNSIQSSNRLSLLDDIVGGSKIDLNYVPPVGLPFSNVTAQGSAWTGDIPDQFRSKLTVQVGALTQQFYSDEISTHRVMINYDRTSASSKIYQVYDDDNAVQTATCASPYCDDGGTGSINYLTLSTAVVLTAAHPYAAGSYANQTLTLAPNLPMTIVQTWGDSSPSSIKFFGDLQEVDPTPFVGSSGAYQYSCRSPQGTPLEACGAPTHGTLIAQLSAQRSAANSLIGSIGSAVLTTHHTLGGMMGANTGSAGLGADVPYEIASTNGGVVAAGAPGFYISAEAVVSVRSSSGSDTQRSAVFETSTILHSVLEGSIGQQNMGSTDPFSGVSGLVYENRYGSVFVGIPAAQMSTALAALSDPFGVGSQWQAAANNGASAIMPTALSIAAGNSFVFTTDSLAFSPNAVSYIHDLSLKGGASPTVADPSDAVLKASRNLETGRAKKYLAVDQASGDFTLTPPADLVTGQGEFPKSLPFQRTYLSGSGAFEPAVQAVVGAWNMPVNPSWHGLDQNDKLRIGGGWTHNYQVGATMGSDALKALGRDSALDASYSIAAIYSLEQLLGNPGFADRFSAIFTTYWLAKQIPDNTVTVRMLPKQEVFTLLPDGSYNPPLGSSARLTKSGARAGPNFIPTGGINSDYVKYDYSNVNLIYTDSQGATLSFMPARYEDYGTAYGSYAHQADGNFVAAQWNFPDGSKVYFDYGAFKTKIHEIAAPTYVQGNYVFPGDDLAATNYYLTGVRNSYGRQLSFTSSQTGVLSDGVIQGILFYDLGRLLTTVTDDSGRAVNYGLSNCPPTYANNGGGNVSPGALANWTHKLLACNTLAVTTPDSATTTYGYAAGADSPDPSWSSRVNYRLRRWYRPGDSSAFEVVSYDPLFKISTVTDILGHASNYYVSAAFSTENWKRTEVVDAIGATSTSRFDQFSSLLSTTDPLGRTHSYGYDRARRKVLEINPEGDGAAYSYDIRSNLLTATRSPKSGSGLSPITTTATYGEATSVYPCANILLCNKVASETDGRGATSTYSWASNGQLTQVSRPADPAGQHPQTNYGYTAYTGSDSSTISLLSSITKKVSSSVNEVKTFGYYSSDHLNLGTFAVDPSGLNLVTTLYYNSQGDPWAIVDPRANQTNFAYDAMRRKTTEGHLTGQNYPWLAMTYWGRDVMGRVVNESRATAFDGSNNPTTWQTWLTSYTPTGEVATKIDPLYHVTTFGYDADDRPIRTIDPTGIVTGVRYDLAGQKVADCRAIGTPLQQGCQSSGQAPTPPYASYSYTLNGKVQNEADARNDTLVYSYDGFDRPAATTYPDSSSETKSNYDANDNVGTETSRQSLQILYTYDALNRKLTEKSNNLATGHEFYNDWWTGIRTSTFSYDLVDRLTNAANDTWPLTWSYDAAGRVTSHSQNWMGSITTAYDAAGNPVLVTHPDGFQESFGYDSLNRMTAAAANGSTVATLGYDTLSRRIGITFGDSSTQTYGYDPADRLTSQGHVFPNDSGSNVSFAYGYDAAGRLNSKTSTNSAYFLTPATAATTYGTANALNQYPTVGGVTQNHWTMGALSYVAPDSQHQYGYFYDERRNLGEIYNYFDQSYRADLHDALGRRWVTEHRYANGTMDEVVFAFDGVRPEARTDINYSMTANWATTTTIGWRDYVLGPNPDERLAYRDPNVSGGGAGTIYYPHTDRQGSTIGLSVSGQNVKLRRYDAYGQPHLTVAALPPGADAYAYLYTGQWYDPTFGGCTASGGLYHYKARAYDAACGRFLQPDPIGTKDDINLYSYTHNSPINGADPTGELDATSAWARSLLRGATANASGGGPENPVADIAAIIIAAASAGADIGTQLRDDQHNPQMLYRALSASDLASMRAGNGLQATDPNGNISIDQHVAQNVKPSQYISLTKDPSVAAAYSSGNGILVINPKALPNSVDISHGSSKLSPRGNANAVRDSEVLALRNVPISAIAGIIPAPPRTTDINGEP